MNISTPVLLQDNENPHTPETIDSSVHKLCSKVVCSIINPDKNRAHLYELKTEPNIVYTQPKTSKATNYNRSGV